MEYSELTIEERRDAIKAELKSYETQHAARSSDAAKYRKLLAAKEAGQFSAWDGRIVQQRGTEWQQQLKAAEADAGTMELLIYDARERLEAFIAEHFATEPVIGG